VTTRERVVEIARGYVGSSDRVGFWLKALGRDPGKSKHWCGAFWLACVKEAGLTDINWGIDGTGVQALHLQPTRRPEPGDLGYIDQPDQHHFLVEAVDGKTYSSIDGNAGTPGVQRNHRALKTTGVLFYSIAPLLRSPTTPAPPSWDEETQPGPPKHPTLRLGAKHEAVRVLQRLLEPMYPGLIIDGQFGPQTAAVVMGFQRRAGLDADGIVGKLTWAALEKAK
jgi:peptidoglycan hydrolase-like protein with peptidoglycan-binding domain